MHIHAIGMLVSDRSGTFDDVTGSGVPFLTPALLCAAGRGRYRGRRVADAHVRIDEAQRGLSQSHVCIRSVDHLPLIRIYAGGVGMRPPPETVHAGNSELPLHRHHEGYIAVVLDGGYDEVSPDGRFRCRVGTVVAHPRYHFHRNRFTDRGARVLNLPVPVDLRATLTYGVTTSTAAEAIVRLAQRDSIAAARAAVEELALGLEPAAGPPAWLAKLADRLRQDVADAAHVSVGDAAREVGVSAAHASRAFKEWFGLPPVRYRGEHRVRRAVFLLQDGMRPIDVAISCGFSDQAHLSRELKKATGLTPGTLSGRKPPSRRR